MKKNALITISGVNVSNENMYTIFSELVLEMDEHTGYTVVEPDGVKVDPKSKPSVTVIVKDFGTLPHNEVHNKIRWELQPMVSDIFEDMIIGD